MTQDLFMETRIKNKYGPAGLRQATIVILTLLITGCGTTDSNNDSNSPAGEWLIPEREVFDGGAGGPDGIPSIDNPKFAPVSEIGFIPDDRKVLGIKIGDEVRAYPHQILDWHEIVNDQIGETTFALTFCPLTGTGICWNRTIDGQTTEFGVSGLIFRNNLVPYDRTTDSRWSQMQMRGVRGDHSGKNIETIDMIETTWKTWKLMYPDSKVLTTDTGFNRNYQGFAYGSTYSTNHSSILFPVKNHDNRLENKVLVHGVIADETADENATVRVYELRKFGEGVTVIQDQLGDDNIVLVGSSDLDFAASFESVLADSIQLTLEPVQNALPVVMEDQEGNKWDVFGYAVEGPRQGEQLQPTKSYTGYWFGWADFFSGLEIYQPE